MLGLTTLTPPAIQFPISSIPHNLPHNNNHLLSCYAFPKTHFPTRRKFKRFVVLANNNNVSNGEPKIQQTDEEREIGSKSNGDDGDSKKDRPSIFSNIRWSDLLLDPDPDNIIAVGLTGLLTWASVQVLCQLLFISLAILVAALKYSFIAAILIFILVTLL